MNGKQPVYTYMPTENATNCACGCNNADPDAVPDGKVYQKYKVGHYTGSWMYKSKMYKDAAIDKLGIAVVDTSNTECCPKNV